MPGDTAGHKSKIEIEFDPSQLTADRIKEISDHIVAELARIATGSRGDISYSRSSHINGHLKW